MIREGNNKVSSHRSAGQLRGWGARRPSSWFCVPQTCPLSSLSLGFCIREIGLGSAGFQPDCREIGSWLSSSPATGTWAHYFSSESHFLVCKVGTPHPVSEGCWEDERRRSWDGDPARCATAGVTRSLPQSLSTHVEMSPPQMKKRRPRAWQRCAQGRVEVAGLESESRSVPLNKCMVPDTY